MKNYYIALVTKQNTPAQLNGLEPPTPALEAIVEAEDSNTAFGMIFPAAIAHMRMYTVDSDGVAPEHFYQFGFRTECSEDVILWWVSSAALIQTFKGWNISVRKVNMMTRPAVEYIDFREIEQNTAETILCEMNINAYVKVRHPAHKNAFSFLIDESPLVVPQLLQAITQCDGCELFGMDTEQLAVMVSRYDVDDSAGEHYYLSVQDRETEEVHDFFFQIV